MLDVSCYGSAVGREGGGRLDGGGSVSGGGGKDALSSGLKS